MAGSVASVFIDEIEVTHVALEGSSTRRLNRVSEAQVRLPMTDAIGGVGSLLKIYFDGVLHFHGRVLLCETTADAQTGYVVYNAADPLELWKWRPVRDLNGNFSLPGTQDQITADLGNLDLVDGTTAGPQMIESMLQNTENPIEMPDHAEGPTFLKYDITNFATGGVDLTGAPVDWPMTMAQLTTLLISTGEVDVVITPIELEDSGYECGDPPATVFNYGEINVYNGDYGTDLTTSVAFQYGMGLHNIQSLRWNQDISQMCNKLWYFLGPKIDNQHWKANVTGDAPAFNPDVIDTGPWALSTGYIVGDIAENGGVTYAVTRDHTAFAINEPGVGAKWRTVWDYYMVPPGGRLSPPAGATNNQIGVQDFLSRCTYGTRMDIKIFDGTDALVGKAFYERLWQEEQWLRAQPLNLVHVTPTRDTEIGAFDIGDLVLVEAVSAVNGGFSGAQRIYEYTLSWDQDSVVTCSELQVSDSNEGGIN